MGFGRMGARGGFGSMGNPLGKAGTSLPPQVIPDNTNYKKGNWTLYLDPYNKGNLSLIGSDSATVFPSTFPNATQMSWTWPTRTPGSPIGFNQLAYGDYFNTAANTPITATTINAINALTHQFNITKPTGDIDVIILDWFLTRAANAHTSATFTGTGSGTNLTVTGVTGTIIPGMSVGAGNPATSGVPARTTIISQTSGTIGGAGVYVTSNATTVSGAAMTASDHLGEVEMALIAPSYFQGYISAIGAGITGVQLGNVTLSGIQFTVARDDTANGGVYPDYVFMPTDLADHLNTTIDLAAVHQWLTTQGVGGNVFYNGHAIGVEPQSGATTTPLTFTSMVVNYQPATTAVVTELILTTGASNWTAPDDFVSLASAEGIAAGGDGAASAFGGSGGGAYAKITSTTTIIRPGTAVPIGVGAAGVGTDGGNTWFNATSLADAVTKGSAIAMGAEGGKLATSTSPASGGLAANSVGTATFNGGSGGTAATLSAGGGGAAGPNGAGGAGSSGSAAAAGGGGGNGGGTNAAAPSGNTGGQGGDNSSSVGHGAGGPSGNPGQAGFAGGGGGGGGNGTTAGGTGGSGIEWDLAHGSGGGGGGEIGSGSTGGHGGLFGGGGGARRSGKGGQGILAVKFNAAILTNRTKRLIAANRGQFPTSITAFSATQTCRKQYNSHPQGAISNLVCVDTNLYLVSIANLSTSAYGMKRYIEYPAGTFTQVTWAGSGSVLLDTFSASSSALKSDPVAITIPANTKFWVRTVWLSGSITNIDIPATAGLDDGLAAGDLGNSGAAGSFASNTRTYGPSAIMGDVAVGSARAFVLLGDSITVGFGDISSVGVAGGAGYMARALDPVAPYFKFGISGMFARDTAPLFSANGVNRLRLFMSTLRYTDYAIAYGVNDLGSGGRTPAQLLADNQTIGSYANAGAKVSISTLTSQSTSTDGWTTTGNQTPPSQAANKATYDDALRAIPAWVTGKVYDAADASMTGRNTEIWRVTGGAWTADGTHPSSLGASSIAAQLTP